MSDPILLLVNVWLKHNDVDAFQAFESKVIARTLIVEGRDVDLY